MIEKNDKLAGERVCGRVKEIMETVSEKEERQKHKENVRKKTIRLDILVRMYMPVN